MLLKGSSRRELSGFRVWCGLHYASLLCQIRTWSLTFESTSPAVAHACRGYYSYLVNVNNLYRNMPSQSPPSDTTPVLRNGRSLANFPNQQKRGPSGNSQLPPAKRCVAIPGGERDYSHGGSSVPATIQGQNCTPSTLLNKSGITDITQRVASTPSAIMRW
jgi:hypothetical protein